MEADQNGTGDWPKQRGRENSKVLCRAGTRLEVVSYAQSIYMHPRLTRQGAPRTQAPRGCVGVWPQPLGSQAQVKVQLKKFHYPMGAKGELLGPGHHKGRRRATQGAEEKDKWVWQRRPPMWAAELQ